MYKCKCCGKETLPVPQADAIAFICPICWWENDVFTADENEPSDENHGLSLNEGRRNYKQYGICDPRLKSKEHIHLSTFAPVDKMLGDAMPFLVTLEENGENELHIVLSVAEVKENTGAKYRPVLPGADRIDIRFDNYIMYQVRNESYASYSPCEVCHGRFLRVFKESKLLDYLKSVTDVQNGSDIPPYPGPWRHYGIRTQNQTIDVVSHFEPMVRIKKSGE